jgi:hypothetical protein
MLPFLTRELCPFLPRGLTLHSACEEQYEVDYIEKPEQATNQPCTISSCSFFWPSSIIFSRCMTWFYMGA